MSTPQASELRTGRQWLAWWFACIVLPVLFGLAILGWRSLSIWVLGFSLVCQMATSLWLAWGLSRKHGRGKVYLVAMVLLLLLASLVLGTVLSFAGCQAAEALHLLPPFRIG